MSRTLSVYFIRSLRFYLFLSLFLSRTLRHYLIRSLRLRLILLLSLILGLIGYLRRSLRPLWNLEGCDQLPEGEERHVILLRRGLQLLVERTHLH